MKIKVDTTKTVKISSVVTPSVRNKNFIAPVSLPKLGWFEEQRIYNRFFEEFDREQDRSEYVLDRLPDEIRMERAVEKAAEEHHLHSGGYCAGTVTECLECEINQGE